MGLSILGFEFTKNSENTHKLCIFTQGFLRVEVTMGVN